jgi:oligopeptide/dipeptide ABC transporter ATP-binding protein
LTTISDNDARNDVLIDIAGLGVDFPTTSGLFRLGHVSAVDKISIQIRKGESIAFVGESGSGKTTIARVLVKLVKPTSGRILFLGEDIFKQSARQAKEYRKHVQMIFQDPYESLNPRATVSQIIEEPLIVHHISESKEERKAKVLQLLSIVGLDSDLARRYPHELSGGQRQRVSIARALAVNPDVIIADEPVSMLDVSIRIGILNLLKDLRKSLNLTFMFITHDLGVARYFCDRIAVIYRGQILEEGLAEELINNRRSPYTKLLLDSVPGSNSIQPGSDQDEDTSEAEELQMVETLSGCRFHPRCTNAQADCLRSPPPLEDVGGKHYVACYHPLGA